MRIGLRLSRGAAVCALISALGLLVPASAAADFTTLNPPFTSQQDFITGLSDPRGLLNDGTNIFVDDNSNGTTYRPGCAVDARGGWNAAAPGEPLAVGLLGLA